MSRSNGSRLLPFAGADISDAELDQEQLVAELRAPVDGAAPAPGLWWEQDENLADRFKRR